MLETSRLILREFVRRDANALELVLSDPQTMRFYPTRLDRGEVEQWIARNRARYRRNGHGLWAMVLKSSGEPVGDCGLTPQEVEGEEATEAARACRDFGFRRLPVERIYFADPPGEIFPRDGSLRRTGKQIVSSGLPHLVYAICRGRTAEGGIDPPPSLLQLGWPDHGV